MGNSESSETMTNHPSIAKLANILNLRKTEKNFTFSLSHRSFAN